MNANQQSFEGGDDGIDLLAAEYVLGVLDPVGRREAEMRLLHDPAFNAEVARWQTCFSPWLASIAPAEVPASSWTRIRNTLWQHELPVRRSEPVRLAQRSLWENLGFWRGVAAGGFAVALASVSALLLTIGQVPAPAPMTPIVVAPSPGAGPMVVSLRHDDGTMAYTATVDPARGTIVMVPIHLGGDQTLAPELWIIPAGDRPHSLGMLDRGKAMMVSIPATLRGAAAKNGLFAITLEPAGSHAHEAPTGPVIAKGNLLRL